MATIKVISGKVSHKSEVLGIGKIIDDIDRENAVRLCECGLCEMLDDSDAVTSAAEIDETKDFAEMTKAELIEYAESIGVEVDGKDTKAKIIEKITTADMPATDIPQE